MDSPASHAAVWVVEQCLSAGTAERLGDARRLADELRAAVGAIVPGADPRQLIAAGADLVVELDAADPGPNTFLAAVRDVLAAQPVRIVVSGDDPDNRALAARYAVATGAALVAPALMASGRGGVVAVTGLDVSGRRARRVEIPSARPAVVTIRDGVAERIEEDPGRTGTVVSHHVAIQPESVVGRRRLPVEPATADIRHLRRLVAGGRGVGGRQGFETLFRVAARLEAGVAASRMAVDLGWIEYDRQVGQTGRTVRPEVYIACGISGASHHLDGMGESGHIIAVNADPDAPIMKKAHLGLVADLHEVLDHVERALQRP